MQIKESMKFAVERHLEGDLDTASKIYSKVLHEHPNLAEAWNLSGVLAHQTGRHADGIQYMTHAISLRSDIPSYYVNLATAFLDLKQPEQAETYCRQCLRIDPKHQPAWNMLGTALTDQNDLSQAIQCFQQSMTLNENDVDTLVNLGKVYFKTQRLDLTEDCMTRSLRLDAGHPVALNNLGAIRRYQQRYPEALDLLERSIKRDPNNADCLVNLGNTLRDLGRFSEAHPHFQKAVELDPSSTKAWNSLGYYYALLAYTEDALECYGRALKSHEGFLHAGSNFLYTLNLADISRADCYEAHRTVAAELPEEQATTFTNDKSADRVLRVGYVSPDFRQHPLVSFFEPILAAHSNSQFEVYCYANVEKPDATTSRLQNLTHHWRSIDGRPDSETMEMIRNDQIDILVDLAGHTANNRLPVFARRAAPVQVSMLGYLNTTGLDTMDYFITDEVRDPVDEDPFFSEEVVRLPGGGSCWSPPKDAPAITTPPVLERQYITFGCMHRPNKLTGETLYLWADVMKAAPNSRLLMFHTIFQDSDELQAHTLKRCQDAGMDISRVDISWHDDNKYLEAYQEMDIQLETIPWSSGTTALESTWMGVPLPTLAGNSPCGRATQSAMLRLGLKEFVANDSSEYVQRIVALASNLDRLSEYRTSLRSRMINTICNAEPMVQQLEDSYRHMWKKVCDAA